MTVDVVGSRSLISGFIHAETAWPDRPALVTSTRTWSYTELGERARQCAAAITECLGRPAGRVGVFAYRTDTAYIGTLAALYSGGAFVPLNRNYPAARTAAMARIAALDAIIADDASARQLDEVLGHLPTKPVIVLPDTDTSRTVSRSATTVIDAQALAALKPLREPPPVLVNEMAYLLFTSGTTGEPKGVQVAHANIIHFIDIMTRRFGITPTDRFSQTFDQTFDPSVMDLFLAWSNGACVYAMSSLELIAPGRYITRNEITVWNSVPSIIALMRRKNFLKPEAFPALRWSLFCGEQLPRQSADAWQRAAPNSIVENLYGPTELTIVCLGHRWDSHTSPEWCLNDFAPIGRPFEGNAVVLVDEQLRPVPEGEAGELCVAGQQTVPGYWNDAAKTAERFVELPVRPDVTMRFYRTGDLARRLGNGEYLCLGRIDHQIKVMGRRVELADIESNLRRMAGVTDAVAVGWPVDGDGRVVGVTAFITGSVPDVSALRDALRQHLPEYMVPGTVHPVDQMPLTPNGKTDRKALLARLTGS